MNVYATSSVLFASFLSLIIYSFKKLKPIIFFKSAVAVEYTDCFSAKGMTPPMSVLDMTLNNLMVRFQ